NRLKRLSGPGHPLARDIAGTLPSVAKLTRDDILEYADSHYRMPNLVIGAAGMIDDSVVAGAVTSKLLLPRELDGAALAEPPGPLRGASVAMRRQRTEQASI